jgi:ABC-2 type transport system permease protein
VTVVRAKDTGTLEQLLMTPAAEWEILLSKIVPLFVLLMGDVCLALAIGMGIFQVPFRGNLLLFLVLSGAIAPIETIPAFFQTLSWFNPLRHYIASPHRTTLLLRELRMWITYLLKRFTPVVCQITWF